MRAIEDAASAAQSGSLAPELRTHTAGEAHKLAGSLGAFGFVHECELARAMEVMLKAEKPLSQREGKRLAQLLHELSRDLQNAPRKYWSTRSKKRRRA
jgi:HPt (histidine-containing phosphotransfer) domain-containing protein